MPLRGRLTAVRWTQDAYTSSALSVADAAKCGWRTAFATTRSTFRPSRVSRSSLTPKVGHEGIVSTGGEFDEEVDVAVLTVEALGRGRTKDQKAADAVGATQPCDCIAVKSKPSRHGKSLPTGVIAQEETFTE